MSPLLHVPAPDLVASGCVVPRWLGQIAVGAAVLKSQVLGLHASRLRLETLLDGKYALIRITHNGVFDDLQRTAEDGQVGVVFQLEFLPHPWVRALRLLLREGWPVLITLDGTHGNSPACDQAAVDFVNLRDSLRGKLSALHLGHRQLRQSVSDWVSPRALGGLLGLRKGDKLFFFGQNRGESVLRKRRHNLAAERLWFGLDVLAHHVRALLGLVEEVLFLLRRFEQTRR